MSDLKIENSKPEYLKYEADRVIFRANSKVIDSLYIVLIGEVAIFESESSRPGDNVEIVAPGNFLAAERFFSATAPTRFYKATTDTILLKFSADKVGQFLSDNYQVASGLIVSLAEKFAKENENSNRYKKTLIDAGLLVERKNDTLPFDSGIFPEEHKQYNIEAPAEYRNYITEYGIICPSCKTDFKGIKQLTMKFKQKGTVGCDLRRHYHDFLPAWYDVQTCPHCLFSFLDSFYQSGGIIKQDLKNTLQQLKPTINLDFSVRRNVDAVFTGYYLAIICAESYRAKYQILARLWRFLSWMYEACGDEEMEHFATEESYKKCVEYYEHEELAEEAKQTLFMISGTLAKKLGKYDEALRHLGNAKFCKTDKPIYKKLIELEIEDIRERRDALKVE